MPEDRRTDMLRKILSEQKSEDRSNPMSELLREKAAEIKMTRNLIQVAPAALECDRCSVGRMGNVG